MVFRSSGSSGTSFRELGCLWSLAATEWTRNVINVQTIATRVGKLGGKDLGVRSDIGLNPAAGSRLPTAAEPIDADVGGYPTI